MSVVSPSAAAFGQAVVGPVVAEFCLRLWTLGALLEEPGDAALLFCARGGLRLELAYERFLAASQLPLAVHRAPLMISRLVAIRPSLARVVVEEHDHLLPGAERTLLDEFAGSTLAEVAVAVTGVAPEPSSGPWDSALTPDGFARLLRHEGGAPVRAALLEQADLFNRHVRAVLGERAHPVLVDTGLRGTTGLLLGEGRPDLRVSSALVASYFPPDLLQRAPRTFGLTLEADGYSPLRPRSVLLRYWQFVEWLFEPDLASVRSFREVDGEVVSNLEVEGWRDRVLPTEGSVFAGVLDYIDALPVAPGQQVTLDARRAWRRLHRAVVFPGAADVEALAVSERTRDFGRDETFAARSWQGPVAALRGPTMWREGEIAASGSRWATPLLVAIEGAYGLRRVRRTARHALRPARPRLPVGGPTRAPA